MKQPKMEARHNKKELSKQVICAYTYKNPASFSQIKEASGVGDKYCRYIVKQLKLDNLLKEIIVFDCKLGRSIINYESNAEYVPIKYVRKTIDCSPKPQKILSDDIISTVLAKLATEAPKAIAIDLNIKLGTVYWIRSRYSNYVL